jgi:hypothetical protein
LTWSCSQFEVLHHLLAQEFRQFVQITRALAIGDGGRKRRERPGRQRH